MAWTTPRDWTDGELVTDVIMDAQVRDNLNVLKTSINDAGLIIPVVSTGTPGASLTPDIDAHDTFVCDGLNANATINAPTGTPSDMRKLIVRIKDDGTSRTLTWDAIYINGGTGLPTATVAGKVMYIGFLYHATQAKWHCVGLQIQA